MNVAEARAEIFNVLHDAEFDDGVALGILSIAMRRAEPVPSDGSCPRCGAELEMSYNFCPHCGQRIDRWSMMKFRHGIFEDGYEAQARGYGYTLGYRERRLQEIGDAYSRSYNDGLIDLKEYRKLTEFLDELLQRNLKPFYEVDA